MCIIYILFDTQDLNLEGIFFFWFEKEDGEGEGGGELLYVGRVSGGGGGQGGKK